MVLTENDEVIWTSDAAKVPQLGLAAVFWHKASKTVFYTFNQWEPGLLSEFDPTIQFLELVALTAGVFLFSEHLTHRAVALWCDSQPVIQMANNGASSCQHCMKLIRLITLLSLKYNVVFNVRYISTKDNRSSDLLSRQKVQQFLGQVPEGWKATRVNLPRQLLPVSKFLSD